MGTSLKTDEGQVGGWRTLPRGTGVNPCTIETRAGGTPFRMQAAGEISACRIIRFFEAPF
jgi:hypothetical protein